MIYLGWRYVQNTGRSFRALFNSSRYLEVRTIASEIEDSGIVVGPSRKFLSDDGNDALSEASELVLAMSHRDEVVATFSKHNDKTTKDYLIYLIPKEYDCPKDSPLLRLALDPKFLEIVSSYLGMWPSLHAIGAWLNIPTDGEAKKSSSGTAIRKIYRS